MSKSTAIAEILPPEPADGGRDDYGKFREGNPGGPGRPPGPIGFTKTMRDALLESFAIVGGTDYLVMIAYWKPELYTALIGRALPIKIAGDENDGIKVINKVTRQIMPAK